MHWTRFCTAVQTPLRNEGTDYEEKRDPDPAVCLHPRCGAEDVYKRQSQHIGAPAKALVKKGDEVFVGTKIGEAGGFVSTEILKEQRRGQERGFSKRDHKKHKGDVH